MSSSQHPATGSSFTRRQNKAHTLKPRLRHTKQARTQKDEAQRDDRHRAKDFITITISNIISTPVISIISIKYIHKRRQANQTDVVA